ncbi:Hypothetical predicted protein [Olea europaea subsp. europaea]|uniref:Uncharacterized protein n=1 Tax=Olea europaea subsp. europaea TaxID=158383 RepID=A0A8S0RBY2_OLEEU|nr:Hypothetical predicted protein [Olea europaea subsp. europaea]
MYDKMVKSFATLANLTCDDDAKSGSILEWIESLCKQMATLRLGCRSTAMSNRTTHLASEDVAANDMGSGYVSIRDTKFTKRKGAPKKLWKRSPLECSSNKAKAGCSTNKGKKPKVCQSNLGDGVKVFQTTQTSQYSMLIPLSYSHLLMGANQSLGFSQHLQLSSSTPRQSR